MKRPERKKQDMEYPDAPSGYVTLYNYKEPFMRFREGYGFEGVVLFDGTTDRVQCHFCGEWFVQLGHHLNREHNMTASSYKERVGLAQSTALIGERFRAKLIASGTSRFENLRAGKKKSAKEKEKIRATLRKNVRQIQNLKGTCPEQLLHRLRALSEKLGRCPVIREVGFYPTLVKVYGSFREACRLVGLVPLANGHTLRSARRVVRAESGTVPGAKVHYSKDELLEALRRFRKANGRDASWSDCKRGLVPSSSRYRYHFGSLIKALRKIA